MSLLLRPKEGESLAGQRFVFFVGFLAIVSQRLVIPAASLSIAVPLILIVGMVIILVIRRLVFIDAGRLVLFCCVIAGGVAVYLVSMTRSTASLSPSLPSLLLLFAVFLPTLLAPTSLDKGRNLGSHFMSGILSAIKLGSILGISQWIFQTAGRGFVDVVGSFPDQFLRTGFNTYYVVHPAVRVGQEVDLFNKYKPNGMIFLEPSNLSLFAAVGLLLCLARLTSGTRRSAMHDTRNAVWVGIFALAIAASGSASGLLVLGFGFAVLLFNLRRNRFLVSVLFAAVILLFAAGVFDALVAKASEGIQGNTSTALRLIKPYQVLPPMWLQNPVFGWGPGVSSELVAATGIDKLQIVTVFKSLIEYGLVGTLPLALLFVWAVAKTTAPLAVCVALLAAYILPADNLFNETLVAMLTFGLPYWKSPLGGSGTVFSPGIIRRDIRRQAARPLVPRNEPS